MAFITPAIAAVLGTVVSAGTALATSSIAAKSAAKERKSREEAERAALLASREESLGEANAARNRQRAKQRQGAGTGSTLLGGGGSQAQGEIGRANLLGG